MESLSKVLIPTPHNSQGHMLQVSSAQETALFVLKSKMPPYVSRKDQNRGEEEVVLKVRRNRAFSLALKREPRVHSPLVLRLVDDQEDLELPHAWRRRRRLDQPGGRGRLLHHVGDGAEEARATGLPPLRSRRSQGRPGRGPGRSRGQHLGRSDSSWGSSSWGRGSGRWGSGGWRSRRVGSLEVRHVAIGEVGDEAAVREASAQEVHGGGRRLEPC